MEDRETTPGAPTPLDDDRLDDDPVDDDRLDDDPVDDDPLDDGPVDDGPQESDSGEASDTTLGGYLEVHERPPAFSGSDEQPYTVSVELESVDNLSAPYVGYLVFPRWAETGLGILGHVETPVLWEGRTKDEVQGRAHALPLTEVKRLLDEAIQRAMQGKSGD